MWSPGSRPSASSPRANASARAASSAYVTRVSLKTSAGVSAARAAAASSNWPSASGASLMPAPTDLVEQAARARERTREVALRESFLQRRAEPRPQLVAADHGGFAIARVRDFADRERAHLGPALECAHERGARVRLTVGRAAGQAQRANERLDGLFEAARVHAPHAEPVVAPPESTIDLFATLRRQRLVVNAVEQALRALERRQRLCLACVLHRADRLRGQLTDLTAERPGEELAERRRARRRHARIVERLVQQAPGGSELLSLHERHHNLFVGRPQPQLRRAGDVTQLGVVGG